MLRDFLPSDADAVAAYQSDPRYLEHYDHSAEITDAHALVELFRQWAEESPRTKYQLAIVLAGHRRVILSRGDGEGASAVRGRRSFASLRMTPARGVDTRDGRVIGTCGIRRTSAGDGEAELGCELDPEYWSTGYAREAAQTMLAYGFETLGLQRINARTLPSNHRAISLALSLGFREVAGGLFVMDRS